MDTTIQNIIIAIVSGLIPALLMSRANNKKTLSEAKRINAESRSIDVQSLSDKLTQSTMSLLSVMEKKVATLEKQRADDRKLIREYANNITKLDKMLSESSLDNESLLQTIQEQSKALKNSELMANSVALEIEDLTTDLSTMKNSIKKLRDELSDMKDLNKKYRNGIITLIDQLKGVGIKPEFELGRW